MCFRNVWTSHNYFFCVSSSEEKVNTSSLILFVLLFNEEAIKYLHDLSDYNLPKCYDEEYICQLPPDENDQVTDEEDIDKSDFRAVIPSEVCGKVSLFVDSKTYMGKNSNTSACSKLKNR